MHTFTKKTSPHATIK